MMTPQPSSCNGTLPSKEIVDHYRAWWAGANTDPLLYMIYPDRRDLDFAPVTKDWMSPPLTKRWTVWLQEFVFGQAVELVWKTGDDRYLEDAFRYIEFYADHTCHAGAGYSFFLPGLGPGCLAAFISNFTEFNQDTIWFELPEAMEWEELEKVTAETASSYAKVAVDAVQRLAKRLEGRFVIAIPDIGGPLDVLSSLRQGTNILMDTLDAPEKLHAVLPKIEAMFYRYWNIFWDMVREGNQGLCAETMRVLSDGPTRISICDFSAMIGPDMFKEFCLPIIERETEKFDGRVIYHMDGPGQMPHLDTLLSIPKLHAIQWVQGAGNPNGFSERWDDLYTRILDAGKKVCFGGGGSDLEQVKAFFQKWPREHFFMPLNPRDARHADEMKRALLG